MTNEMMNMNELDAVSGGTTSEFFELQRVAQHYGGADICHCFREHEEERKLMVKWLKENTGIEATIYSSTGLHKDPNYTGQANVYKLNGKEITHREALYRARVAVSLDA